MAPSTLLGKTRGQGSRGRCRTASAQGQVTAAQASRRPGSAHSTCSQSPVRKWVLVNKCKSPSGLKKRVSESHPGPSHPPTRPEAAVSVALCPSRTPTRTWQALRRGPLPSMCPRDQMSPGLPLPWWEAGGAAAWGPCGSLCARVGHVLPQSSGLSPKGQGPGAWPEGRHGDRVGATDPRVSVRGPPR